MYKSPIEIIYGDIKCKQEDEIYKAIVSYDIHVDKDELLRALSYDRMQYEAGYRSGVIDVINHLKDKYIFREEYLDDLVGDLLYEM